MSVLATLKRAGLTATLRDDRVVVTPRSGITDSLREHIKANLPVLALEIEQARIEEERREQERIQRLARVRARAEKEAARHAKADRNHQARKLKGKPHPSVYDRGGLLVEFQSASDRNNRRRSDRWRLFRGDDLGHAIDRLCCSYGMDVRVRLPRSAEFAYDGTAEIKRILGVK